eukprot:g4848.t1
MKSTSRNNKVLGRVTSSFGGSAIADAMHAKNRTKVKPNASQRGQLAKGRIKSGRNLLHFGSNSSASEEVRPTDVAPRPQQEPAVDAFKDWDDIENGSKKEASSTRNASRATQSVQLAKTSVKGSFENCLWSFAQEYVALSKEGKEKREVYEVITKARVEHAHKVNDNVTVGNRAPAGGEFTLTNVNPDALKPDTMRSLGEEIKRNLKKELPDEGAQTLTSTGMYSSLKFQFSIKCRGFSAFKKVKSGADFACAIGNKTTGIASFLNAKMDRHGPIVSNALRTATKPSTPIRSSIF